ncbi:MAG: glycosyltransferase family 4 protein [Clostridium sp.]|uniref:glycosyltransferase family 4 protein n=1 Tax=Clostridium sp. TaxID=1506 RepID=UPI003EE47B1B
MKVLFITTEGFDTPGPNNQMAMVMINDFLNQGINVHLIQSRRKKINSDIPEMLKNKKKFTYDVIDRKIIDKTNFINRYIDEAWFAITSFKKWNRIKDFDIVFLQSCPTVIYQMIMIKLFSKKPIVYNIYDVFPGHAYDIGVIKNRCLYEILRTIQKFTYKMSSIITVLSDDMKEKIICEKVIKEKVRVISPWYDDKSVKEILPSDNKFLKKYNINNQKFYVQFAGTIGYVFNYKAIIEAAKLLKREKNIIFQIIGDGNVKNDFIKEVKDNNLNNIEFYPLQPIEIVPDVYSACSICVIPLKKGVIGNGTPSKAPLLMACNRVIVNSVEKRSNYFQMFNENKLGISVSNENHEELANAILYLYENPEEIKVMSKNSKEFAKKNYTSTKNTQKFIDIFYELIEGE